MAKTKVHELASLLNMTNRELLEKLQGLNIPVNLQTPHMTVLDEESTARIKAHLTAKPHANVEEKRISDKVIRRRKKTEEPVSTAPEPEQDAASAPQAPPAGEEEGADGTQPEAVSGPSSSESPTFAGSAPEATDGAGDSVAESQEAVSGASGAPAPKASPKVEKAKIIKPAAPPVLAPKAEEPEPAQAAAPPATEASAPVKEEPEKPSVEAAPAQEPVFEEESGPDSQEETSAQETESGAEASSDKGEAGRPGQPIIQKKKKKKETAARIIKLPDAPVKPTLPATAAEQRPARHYPPRPATAPPPAVKRDDPASQAAAAAAAERDKKKKKTVKRKEDETPEADPRFLKKKISFRKREVVEGAALYDQENVRGRKGGKGGRAAMKPKKPLPTVSKAIKRRLRVDDNIVVSDLAKRMGIKASELIKKLLIMGTPATLNQSIDYDTAALLATEFDYEVERAAFEEDAVLNIQAVVPENLVHRPPVVTIMGHVDHGKTSLLDVIRKTRVTDTEAGGITQHIGAYTVETERGRVTFLDTPGHEAFTQMRARGAKVTDIVVLVVAADDGVMPQTIEAVHHAKDAKVPIIVAVNKMDKQGADPERVMRELANHGLQSEEWGGDTIFVKVSAKAQTGIDTLLEMILIQAEVLELTADAQRPAVGHVVEARMDPGRGPVATILIREGTLKTGDAVVCGAHYGKLKAMTSDRGEMITEAGPSYPVEILGLSGVPFAGDELVAVDTEKNAKQVAMHRAMKLRTADLARIARPTLENLFAHLKEGETKDLKLIIKADVQGSIEALRESLEKLSGEEVRIVTIHAGTGAVSESDVSLAAVSGAIIISFNVRPNAKVAEFATSEGVDIRFYDIIYNAISDVKDAIVGLMKPTYQEHVSGHVEIRKTFTIPKIGTIAGCYVTDGKAERNRKLRLLRDGVVVYDGKVASLKRVKDDAKEVAAGYECGIGIENFNDIKEGDVMEFYYIEEIKPVFEQ
ncbi:MAG: translation initiation factor IF-2 [Deltaproteobacteria bacterium]|nr:translation initiation factor IF-2 [Deltaproteobacteria bacterium]